MRLIEQVVRAICDHHGWGCNDGEFMGRGVCTLYPTNEGLLLYFRTNRTNRAETVLQSGQPVKGCNASLVIHEDGLIQVFDHVESFETPIVQTNIISPGSIQKVNAKIKELMECK